MTITVLKNKNFALFLFWKLTDKTKRNQSPAGFFCRLLEGVKVFSTVPQFPGLAG